MLLAFLVPYLEIYILPNLKEEHFYTYIASKRQTKTSNKSLFLEEIYMFRSRTGIENFQLCASLMWKHRKLGNLSKNYKKYLLSIGATKGDQRYVKFISNGSLSYFISVLPCAFYNLESNLYLFGFDIVPTDIINRLYVSGINLPWQMHLIM